MQLQLIGDVMLGRFVNEALMEKAPEFVWSNTISILDQGDFRMCNLECVISDSTLPLTRSDKPYYFRTDTKNIAVLKAAGMNAVSLANNHTLDFGEAGLRDTVRTLDRNRIKHSGAGNDYSKAAYPAFCDVLGKTVAVINATDNEPGWAANQKPGTNYIEPKKSLINSVKQEKHKVDVLIVSLHWGGNWGYEVPTEHKELAHALIDAGADIIFGHSPHVFRGIEIYKNKPIIYSAGNFIDDYAIDPFERNDHSFIFVIDLVPPKIIRLTLCPTIMEDYQAKLASGETASRIAHKMMELCKPFNTKVEWHHTQDYLEINLYDQTPTLPRYERARAASRSFGRV